MSEFSDLPYYSKDLIKKLKREYNLENNKEYIDSNYDRIYTDEGILEILDHLEKYQDYLPQETSQLLEYLSLKYPDKFLRDYTPDTWYLRQKESSKINFVKDLWLRWGHQEKGISISEEYQKSVL